jgi:hypothetical protein
MSSVISAKIDGSRVTLHDVNGMMRDQVSPPGPGRPQSAYVNGDVLIVNLDDGLTVTYQKTRNDSFAMQSLR